MMNIVFGCINLLLGPEFSYEYNPYTFTSYGFYFPLGYSMLFKDHFFDICLIEAFKDWLMFQIIG